MRNNLGPLGDSHKGSEAKVLTEYRSKSRWLSDLMNKEEKDEADRQRISELQNALDEIEGELKVNFAWGKRDIDKMKQGRPDHH